MRKIKIILSFMLILAALLLTACGNAQQSTSAASGASSASAALTEPSGTSILTFNDDEDSAKLVQFFAEGNVPMEASFRYDQMGANPEITLTDPEQITELYQLLSKVEVTGESDMSATDCYHYVQFKLADDCYIHYSFEGSELYCLGNQNYSIENSKELFRFMSRLTEEYLENGGN